MEAAAGLSPTVAILAFAAGFVGAVVTALLAPRRTSPAALALLAGFGCLMAAGAVAGSETAAPGAWSSTHVFGAGVCALAVAGVACVVESRARECALRVSSGASEALRRELDRLSGINVRLEDEGQELRRRVRLNEERRSGSGAVVEATVARQRHALDTANEQVRRHRSVFESSADGMAFLERETLRMSEVNAAMQALTGRDAADLASTSVLDLLGGGAARPGRADLQRCARDRRPLAATIVRKDGAGVVVSVFVIVVGADVDARLLVVLRDTSEQRAAEARHREEVAALGERMLRVEESRAASEVRCAELEHANRCLTDLSERKDLYLSSVSHELRTPLASIRSFSEILVKHEDAEPAVRREFLEIIQKESDRLTRLVNNVLDLARIEAGATKLLRSDFDARGVLMDAVASVRGLAAESGVRVVARTGDAPLTLRADRDRVQQLLVNLLGNAIKFSPEGAEVSVETGEGESEDRVRFTVRDHGRGIAPEHVDRVFDRFQRAEADSSVAGTGLGLSICREIATMHGGRIWAESKVGVGSVFRAEFPSSAEPRSRPLRTESAVHDDVAAEDRVREITREITRELSGARPARDAMGTTGTLPPLRR